MINLQVSESYALDYLSILCVKAKKSPTLTNCNNYHTCLNNIGHELGFGKLTEILSSSEYKNLRACNLETFEAVDKAKTDEIPASAVDRLNYERFLYKKSLQDKFFDEKLTEQKLGYS
jgi:hypothetical protein